MWMKTTTVTANAYQLTRLGFVNCYLVREADGLSLIDTGLPGSANDILAAARELGAPIRRIVLTTPTWTTWAPSMRWSKSSAPPTWSWSPMREARLYYKSRPILPSSLRKVRARLREASLASTRGPRGWSPKATSWLSPRYRNSGTHTRTSLVPRRKARYSL